MGLRAGFEFLTYSHIKLQRSFPRTQPKYVRTQYWGQSGHSCKETTQKTGNPDKGEERQKPPGVVLPAAAVCCKHTATQGQGRQHI